MREITIKITFDDTDGYKGHGDDTKELIEDLVTSMVKIELEDDNVITPDWKVEVIDFKEIDNE